MKIVTPLLDADGYIDLVEAGADEFFCGFIPYEWLKKNNNSIPLNRREQLLNCNISSLSSMKILRKRIEKYGAEVKITLNSLYYNEENYGIVLNMIKELMAIGYTTFIIADLALIIYLREQGIDCKIHLSGENSDVNHWSINFFNNYDISRYIFTRKNTVEHIKSCIENCNKTNLEFEAFILNELCAYSGAYCNSIHSDEILHACNIPYLRTRLDDNSDKFRSVKKIHKLVNQNTLLSLDTPPNKDVQCLKEEYVFAKTGCGICAIKRLMDVGITHFKVVGRGKPLNQVVQDVKNLRDCIEMAQKENSDTEYVQKVKEKYFESVCKTVCYYP